MREGSDPSELPFDERNMLVSDLVSKQWTPSDFIVQQMSSKGTSRKRRSLDFAGSLYQQQSNPVKPIKDVK